MGYVMVPVPEEFVQEAMKMVLRLASSDRVHDWDQETIAQLFQDVPEMSKAVLSAVARASIGDDGSIEEEELARSLEHSVREVRELARAVNAHAQDNSYAPVVAIVTTAETLPNGRTRDIRRFSVEAHVAEWLREAEREEAKSLPHPLLGGAE